MCVYLKKLLVNIYFKTFTSIFFSVFKGGFRKALKLNFPTHFSPKILCDCNIKVAYLSNKTAGRNVFFASKWLGVLLLDGFWVKIFKVVAHGNLGWSQWFLKAPQVLICVLINCQHLKGYTHYLFMLTSLQVSGYIKTRKYTGGKRGMNEWIGKSLKLY